MIFCVFTHQLLCVQKTEPNVESEASTLSKNCPRVVFPIVFLQLPLMILFNAFGN